MVLPSVKSPIARPVPRRSSTETVSTQSDETHRNNTSRRLYSGSRLRRLPIPLTNNEIDLEIERLNRFCDNVDRNIRTIDEILAPHQNVDRSQSTPTATATTQERRRRPHSSDVTVIDLSNSPPRSRRHPRQIMQPPIEINDGFMEQDSQVVIDLCTPVRVSAVSRPQIRHIFPSTSVMNLSDDIICQETESKSNTSINDNSSSNSNDGSPVLICPICMENYINKQPTSTKCGHIFCECCIRQSIRMTGKCPICKTKQSQKLLHRVYF